MALNARQLAAYRHLCKIISVTRTIDGTLKPGDETYALFADNVPCLYEQTPNVDDPVTGIGRVKRQTILTEDVIHMEANSGLKDGWILKDISVLPDGTNSPNYGTYHRVHGAPKIIPNAGSRTANKMSVMGMTMESVPAVVAAL